MSDMNITIKNVKIMQELSEETFCFHCTVYVDGKRSFTAQNDGHGGSNMYYPLPSGDGRTMRLLIADIETELGKTIITTSNDFEMPNDLELVIGELLNEHQIDKDVKTLLRKIVYIKDGKIYSLPTKFKATATTIAGVKNASWWKDDRFTMLNSLSFAEAKAQLINAGW